MLFACQHTDLTNRSPIVLFQEMAEALFYGCGYVPDLLSLQAWLECAWKGGFDTAGGDMLGNIAQNSDQWIGTTECAALLRFFGLKAQIIDFTGRGFSALSRLHKSLNQQQMLRSGGHVLLNAAKEPSLISAYVVHASNGSQRPAPVTAYSTKFLVQVLQPHY